MERSSSLASEKLEDSDFNLKEWALRARRISRENTNSRRFSASNLKSFREEARSFRSNVTVSNSTASSPGYTTREEIDPSTYSFTTALRALQTKTVYTWELQPREGLTLNSKWNEAEKYISNPLSGEVPLECLSAKTLSGRSFRGLNSRITMSAPLIYTSQMHLFHTNPTIDEHEPEPHTEKKTRDVGTQSTPVNLSSSSPSPAPTPSIEERPTKITSGDSSVSLNSDTEVEMEESRGRERKQKHEMMGCLSFRSLWTRTQRHKEKHKPRTNMLSTFLHHINGCTKE